MIPLAKKLRELKQPVPEIVTIVRGELKKSDSDCLQAPVTFLACDHVVELFESNTSDGECIGVGATFN